MKSLSLIILLVASVLATARTVPKREPFPLFELYVNDTLSISSYLVTRDNLRHVFAHERGMDLTYDHMVYVLHKTSYTIYVPKLHTAFEVKSRNNKYVGEHLCWFINRVRQVQDSLSITSKQQNNE